MGAMGARRLHPLPPPPELECSWSLSDIFNACLSEEDIAESILLNVQYEVDAELEAADTLQTYL